jgi:hypothetical protein
MLELLLKDLILGSINNLKIIAELKNECLITRYVKIIKLISFYLGGYQLKCLTLVSVVCILERKLYKKQDDGDDISHIFHTYYEKLLLKLLETKGINNLYISDQSEINK